MGLKVICKSVENVNRSNRPSTGVYQPGGHPGPPGVQNRPEPVCCIMCSCDLGHRCFVDRSCMVWSWNCHLPIFMRLHVVNKVCWTCNSHALSRRRQFLLTKSRINDACPTAQSKSAQSQSVQVQSGGHLCYYKVLIALKCNSQQESWESQWHKSIDRPSRCQEKLMVRYKREPRGPPFQ